MIGPKYPSLMSELPTCLLTELFAGAELVRLRAGAVLFRAGDSSNGCYRVEDGLLKVTMVSSSGAERILAFLSRDAIVGELSTIDGLPRSATVVAVMRQCVSLAEPRSRLLQKNTPSSTNTGQGSR